MRALPSLCSLTLLLLACAPPLALHAAATPTESMGAGGGKASSPERQQILWDQGFQLPAGARLRFAKIDETAGPDGHTLRYRIYADAASQGTAYVLGLWRIGTDLDNMEILSETAFVNRRGLLMNNLPNPGQADSPSLDDGSEIDVSVKVAKGEPVRLILRTQDWKTMIGGTLVPYPLEATDKGCKLSALLAQPEANSVLVYADGFPPNSILPLSGSLDGATNQQKIYADARGHGSAIEQPRVKGVDTGTLTESVKTPGCSVTVSLPWGKGSYHQQ